MFVHREKDEDESECKYRYIRGDCAFIDVELKKLDAAVRAGGADSVMDLSTGGDLNEVRRQIEANCPVMLGTVPIYAVAAELAMKDLTTDNIDEEVLLRNIEKQCREGGVDYITVHCGITKESVARMDNSERTCGIVSRGGSILANWIRKTGKRIRSLSIMMIFSTLHSSMT